MNRESIRRRPAASLPGARRVAVLWLGLLAALVVAPGAPRAQSGPGAGNPEYKERTLKFLALVREDKCEEACRFFNESMAKELPAPNLRSAWQSLLQKAGSFQSFGNPAEKEEGGYLLVDVPARFQAKEYTLRVAWEPKGAVAGFGILGDSTAAESPAPAGTPTHPNPAGASTTTLYSGRPNPPTPADIREELVMMGDDPWKLPGFFSFPAAPQGSPSGKLPAVLLVHGSGAKDLDETIGPNKPFRDLAWGLASKGIAVFRHEKRGRIYPPTLNPKTVTVEDEFLADVSIALRLLESRPEIDPKRIFLAGYAQGGYLAPVIAQRHPELAGVAILSGSARPPIQVLMDQLIYVRFLRSDPSKDSLLAVAQAQARAAANPSTPDSFLVMGTPVRYLRELTRLDPVGAARKLKLPVLVLQGGRDYLTTAEDLGLWKSALSGNSQVTFKLYPDLNHIFHTGVGKSEPQEFSKPGVVAPEVIQDLAAWIQAH